jgi:hypothetical protein
MRKYKLLQLINKERFKMRTSIYLIIGILIISAGCEKKPMEYPNVSIAQVIQDMKWDYNYAKVKTILETKYGLEFSNEIKQNKKSKGIKVYRFEGGVLNGVKTGHWVVDFVNDSLNFIFVGIVAETLRTYQTFKDSVNNLAYEKFARAEGDWFISEKGKAKCRILITDWGKEIGISFSSEKFLNKCSYM